MHWLEKDFKLELTGLQIRSAQAKFNSTTLCYNHRRSLLLMWPQFIVQLVTYSGVISAHYLVKFPLPSSRCCVVKIVWRVKGLKETLNDWNQTVDTICQALKGRCQTSLYKVHTCIYDKNAPATGGSGLKYTLYDLFPLLGHFPFQHFWEI